MAVCSAGSYSGVLVVQKFLSLIHLTARTTVVIPVMFQTEQKMCCECITPPHWDANEASCLVSPVCMISPATNDPPLG